MGKWKWFRNPNLINILVGALGAGLWAAYEYWIAEERLKKRRIKRKKKGGKRVIKKTKKAV